jgi:predicted nucleic acid-binding protein
MTPYTVLYICVMVAQPILQAVIDTNVLFGGITTQGSTPGLIIDAWLGELFVACVSNALAYEYLDVLSRKLSAARWLRRQPVGATLLAQARFVPIYFSWRPMSPDPGDDHIIDCAMNAGVPVVTANVQDFRLAAQALGLVVLTPVEFVMRLDTV